MSSGSPQDSPEIPPERQLPAPAPNTKLTIPAKRLADSGHCLNCGTQLQGPFCHYCGQQVPPKELTLDHLVPLARGGKSTKGNCVPACKDCNNKKKNLLPLEWEEHLKRLQKQ